MSKGKMIVPIKSTALLLELEFKVSLTVKTQDMYAFQRLWNPISSPFTSKHLGNYQAVTDIGFPASK